jgi:hypothetical protein
MHHRRNSTARIAILSLVAGLTAASSTGCVGRLLREGAGLAGARPKVIQMGDETNLTIYTGLIVEPVTNPDDVPVPETFADLITGQFEAAADKLELTQDATPALRLTTYILHYESGGIVDEVIGPLEEVVLRATLTDVATGQTVSVANLVSRSKATTSSGKKSLSAGAGKALHQWLRPKEKENEEDDEKSDEAAADTDDLDSES